MLALALAIVTLFVPWVEFGGSWVAGSKLGVVDQVSPIQFLTGFGRSDLEEPPPDHTLQRTAANAYVSRFPKGWLFILVVGLVAGIVGLTKACQKKRSSVSKHVGFAGVLLSMVCIIVSAIIVEDHCHTLPYSDSGSIFYLVTIEMSVWAIVSGGLAILVSIALILYVLMEVLFLLTGRVLRNFRAR